MTFSFGNDIANYIAEVSYATITPSINIIGAIKATGIAPTTISETNPQNVINVEEGSIIEPICEKSTGLYKKQSITSGNGDKLREEKRGCLKSKIKPLRIFYMEILSIRYPNKKRLSRTFETASFK
jgi:hypothetical protein